ncbi:MAG: transcriptional repressor LexA, partial [Chlamydiia bacterium]|nr:transcriptional repressor LexA [Chlamydiia bacterium]
MKGLTERQREVLTYIENFIAQHHYSPSYNEIKKHFSFSSLGSVYKHIQVLKRKGHLNLETHCSRSLALTKDQKPLDNGDGTKLPFIGQISMGTPIETFLKWQDVAVPPHMLRDASNSYIIQVRGDDMLSEHLLDGDLLIVEASDEAQAGDTVLALLHDEESMIRR